MNNLRQFVRHYSKRSILKRNNILFGNLSKITTKSLKQKYSEDEENIDFNNIFIDKLDDQSDFKVKTTDSIENQYNNMMQSTHNSQTDYNFYALIEVYEKIIKDRLRYEPKRTSIAIQYLDLIARHINKQLKCIDPIDINSRLVDQGFTVYKYLNFITNNIKQQIHPSTTQEKLVDALETIKALILKKKKLSQISLTSANIDYYITYDLNTNATCQLIVRFINLSIFKYPDNRLITDRFFDVIGLLMAYLLKQIVVEAVDISNNVNL